MPELPYLAGTFRRVAGYRKIGDKPVNSLVPGTVLPFTEHHDPATARLKVTGPQAMPSGKRSVLSAVSAAPYGLAAQQQKRELLGEFLQQDLGYLVYAHLFE